MGADEVAKRESTEERILSSINRLKDESQQKQKSKKQSGRQLKTLIATMKSVEL